MGLIEPTFLPSEGFLFRAIRVNPHFSRAAFGHLQCIQGRSFTLVPQAFDNAANGRLRFALGVNVFSIFYPIVGGQNVHRNFWQMKIYLTVIMLFFQIYRKNIHKICGLDSAPQ